MEQLTPEDPGPLLGEILRGALFHIKEVFAAIFLEAYPHPPVVAGPGRGFQENDLEIYISSLTYHIFSRVLNI